MPQIPSPCAMSGLGASATEVDEARPKRPRPLLFTDPHGATTYTEAQGRLRPTHGRSRTSFWRLVVSPLRPDRGIVRRICETEVTVTVVIAETAALPRDSSMLVGLAPLEEREAITKLALHVLVIPTSVVRPTPTAVGAYAALLPL